LLLSPKWLLWQGLNDFCNTGDLSESFW
jgi:hypothetical protein